MMEPLKTEANTTVLSNRNAIKIIAEDLKIRKRRTHNQLPVKGGCYRGTILGCRFQ